MNDNKEKIITETTADPAPKKKLRGYALVRVIMMWFFAATFVIFATVWVIFLVRDHIANGVTDGVMSGFDNIIYDGTAPSDTDPIVFPGGSDSQTPESSEDPGDDAYAQYVASCIAEAKAMKEQYPDFRGIIVIEGDTINLRYPIMQSTDNQYYVGHLIDGTANSTGEIFMDYRNGTDIMSNMNSVFYGHNMNNGTKFGQIKNYKYNNAFYTHNITVITAEAVLTFKPFSFYKTDVYNPYNTTSFKNTEEFAAFCTSEQERSMFKSSYSFTGQERIITLSTCYGTSKTERYCLHAVLVNVSK